MNTNSIKSATVTVIKTIVAPAHITLQASADLLALGEAKLINVVDGTPVFTSVMQRTAHTQHKIESVVAKAMEIKERREAKKELARQMHVDSLKSKLDQAEGVEHNVISIPVPPIDIPAPPKKESSLTKKINEVASDLPFITPIQAFGDNNLVTE